MLFVDLFSNVASVDKADDLFAAAVLEWIAL